MEVHAMRYRINYVMNGRQQDVSVDYQDHLREAIIIGRAEAIKMVEVSQKPDPRVVVSVDYLSGGWKQLWARTVETSKGRTIVSGYYATARDIETWDNWATQKVLGLQDQIKDINMVAEQFRDVIKESGI